MNDDDKQPIDPKEHLPDETTQATPPLGDTPPIETKPPVSVTGHSFPTPFAGLYHIERELGRGGMGRVFLARKDHPTRPVALKMISSGEFASSDEVHRFLTEIEAASSLDHPNIITIYDSGQHNDQYYYTMRYIDGGTLQSRVEATMRDPSLAALYVSTIARAVEHAHQHNIVHRDLKPVNVLIDSHGNLIIADFGLAKCLGVVGATATGQILGTPQYMAPELADGKAIEATPAADIYSMGGILYYLLTGRPPHEGRTYFDVLKNIESKTPASPRSLNARVDRGLEAICAKAMSKQPGRRHLTAKVFAEALDEWLNKASDRPFWTRLIRMN